MVKQRLFLVRHPIKKPVALFALNSSEVGLKLLSLTEASEDDLTAYQWGQIWYRRIKLSESQFYRFVLELASLLQASSDIVSALEWLKDGASDWVVQAHLHEILWQLKQGQSLSQALPWHSCTQRDSVCRTVLRWAETKGMLIAALNSLAQYLKLGDRLRKQYEQVLYYPCTVLVLSCMAAIYLVSTVLPMLKGYYPEDLPKLSRYLLTLSAYPAKRYIVAMQWIIGIVWIVRRIPGLRGAISSSLSSILGLAALQQQIEALLFVKLCSVALQAKAPLPDLLREFSVLHGSLGSIARALVQHLDEGVDLMRAVQKLGMLNSILARYLCLGVRNDSLTSTLVEAEQELLLEIEQSIQKKSAILSPILLSIVGLLLAIFLYAIYAPLLKLPQQFFK